ncbi:T9SS type A sorting domain-containing protein, partial [bacterium]|nr:T9SS type A sorting domain-containing protein [bacterium]
MDVLGASRGADEITWWESDLIVEHIEEPPHSDLPGEFTLHDAFPNPFNAATSISFGLPNRSTVRINVLDLYGRTVATLADRTYETGFHSVTWDATAFSTGIYLVRLEAGEVVRTVKMTLIR